MKNFALLVLRLVTGGLMAGHGAQKLFGWFGGHGLQGTAGWLESMGMKPGKPWAVLASAGEFGGGVLTALGFLSPVGSVGTIGAMSMATAKVHWGKPIWVSSGGAELTLINIAAALALGLLGPGKYSVDEVTGIRLPRRLTLVPGLLMTAAAVTYAMVASNRPQEQTVQAAGDAEQAQPEEEQMQAVPVPDSPPTEMVNRERQAEEQAELVAGAELQAGHGAEHPI